MKTLKGLSSDIDKLTNLLKTGELNRLTIIAQTKDETITIDLTQMELLLLAMISENL